MILPSAVVKIIGFVDESGVVHKKPISGSNNVKTQLDNGRVVIIGHYSGNKNFNSLHDYLHNKADLGVKADKVRSLVGDILLDDSGLTDSMLDKATASLQQQNTNLSGKALQKEAAGIVAGKILKNRQLVQSSAVVRSAIAFSDDYQNVNVKSIYTKFKDGKLTYDTSGIYSQAMLPTHIPVEIEAIVGNDGVFCNLFKMTTSSLIRGAQCNSILEHCFRTIQHSIPQNNMPLNSPVYLPYIMNQQNFPPMAKRMNDISKINSKLPKDTFLDINLVLEFQNLLSEFIQLFKQNASYYKFFKIQIPLLMDTSKYVDGMKYINPNGGKSPIQMFRNAAVNMNFSKESTATKDMLKQYILDEFLSKMATGLYRPKLLLTYNIAGNEILGEGISWGFMYQNIDFSKITLGIDDSMFIIESTSQYLDMLKQTNQIPQG